MKKKVFLGLGMLLTVGALVACSSNNGNNTDSPSNSVSTNEPIGFMKLAQEDKERIWYRVSIKGTIAKDSDIEAIHVVKNGKITTYTLKNIYDENLESMVMTLKDIDKMSDEEVLKKIQKAEKENTQYFVQDLQNSAQNVMEYNLENLEYHKNSYKTPDQIQQIEDSLLKENLYLEDYYSKKVAQLSFEDISSKKTKTELKAVVETDASGNNVIAEAIFFNHFDYGVPDNFERNFDEGMDTVAKKEVETLISVDEDYQEMYYPVRVQIYDTVYLGFDDRTDLEGSYGTAIITRSLPEDTILGFDTLDTSNVEEDK